MNRIVLTLTLTAQLAATAAFAQTDTTTTGTGTADPTLGNFGSDWSSSMGTALMNDDGMTVRSSTELTTQWQTLSEADKEMVRRDCMVHMQTTGGTDTSTTGTTSDTTSGSTTTDPMTTAPSTTTDPNATATTTTSSDSTAATGSGTTPMNITAEQMDQICAAVKDL